MKNKISNISFVVLVLFLYSCHRKAIPAKSETDTVVTTPVSAKKVAPVSAKEYLKEKAKKGEANPPQVIVVNDKAAGKTADGKYYYELNGYRYWKNNKDGKYYLNGIFTKKAAKKKSTSK